MRQKVVVGALLAFTLLMAALELVAGRHPTSDVPVRATDTAEPVLPSAAEAGSGEPSASPALTR